MSFMQKQITFDRWTVVDTACGIWSIPQEYTPLTLAAFNDESIEDALEVDGVKEELLQYTEAYKPEQIYNVELTDGFGARLSAPGYMDCTEWAVFSTEDEAEAYLEEMYGDDNEDEE